MDLEVSLVGVLASANEALEVLLHAMLAGHVAAEVALVPEALRADLAEERVRPAPVLVVLVLQQSCHPSELLAAFLALIGAADFRRLRKSVRIALLLLPRSTPLQHNWRTSCSTGSNTRIYRLYYMLSITCISCMLLSLTVPIKNGL